MFLRCPHCGFLVALAAARNGADGNCPQCHGALRVDGAPAPEPAPATGGNPSIDTASTPDAGRGSEAPAGAAAGESMAGLPRSATDAIAASASASASESESESASTASPDPIASARGTVGADAPPASIGAPTGRSSRPPRLVTAPRFARRTLSMVEAGPRWPGLAIITMLAVLLSLQLLLAQRAQLAGQPRWRPVLEQVCGVLGCSLPAWREPDAFAMVARSVRPSPAHPGVLEITATFRNDATREQAWPVLLLSLSDVHGQTIGARAFQPGEYRDARTTGDTLAPGQTVTVLLDVVEPAPDTVAFNFDFR